MSAYPELITNARESSRFREGLTLSKQLLGRAALILSFSFAPAIATYTGKAVFAPEEARAETVFSNDYPDMDAMEYNLANYDWWKDEDGNQAYSGSGELLSSRGYAYRNCTDGAAYWVGKYTGVDVRGWGNAITWDNSAAPNTNYSVKEGNANNIEVGDIAQSDDGYYGHVGFVTGVTKSADGIITSIDTAELNAAGTGEYSVRNYSSRRANGNFMRGNSSWHHFIDVNGAGKGLNNETVTSQSSDKTIGDWNKDGTTDIGIFRPSDGTWHIRGVADFAYGQSGDIPVPGDYDGNGTIEAAVYRPSNGTWYVRGGMSAPYGQSGDVPVPADWNKDGSTDIAIWRPSTGNWHIRGIGDFTYGQPGDIPLPGDYNGDGITEAAIWRPGNGMWYVRGGSSAPYGIYQDIPMPANFNKDGMTDVAIFRPSDGGWHIRGIGDFAYGQPGDIPLVGDFDGNKTNEAAVYRPSTGTWYIRGGNSVPYGNAADIPVISPLNAVLLKQTRLMK